MEKNEIASVNNSFIYRIIKKIILFFKKKNDFDNKINIQHKIENNNEFKQDKNRKKYDLKADLKIKDTEIEGIEFIRKKYEEDEKSVNRFTDEEIEELIKLYKSESKQLRKEIEKYEKLQIT